MSEAVYSISAKKNMRRLDGRWHSPFETPRIILTLKAGLLLTDNGTDTLFKNLLR
jgi:hypothetical protein